VRAGGGDARAPARRVRPPGGACGVAGAPRHQGGARAPGGALSVAAGLLRARGRAGHCGRRHGRSAAVRCSGGGAGAGKQCAGARAHTLPGVFCAGGRAGGRPCCHRVGRARPGLAGRHPRRARILAARGRLPAAAGPTPGDAAGGRPAARSITGVAGGRRGVHQRQRRVWAGCGRCGRGRRDVR